MTPHIEYRCPYCDSDCVLQDAYVNLNTGEASTFDQMVCGECSAEFNIATEVEVPAPPKTFTVFCQQADGRGTIWISRVEAPDFMAAISVGRQHCAHDWGYSDDPDDETACGTLSDIHVLGVAEGDVNILHWEDIYA